MAQTIAAVDNPGIEHGVLIDLSLPDPVTGVLLTYRISNCYTNITYNSYTYQALGGFLDITDIQGDLQSTNNDVTLSLSAIPAEYIEAIMSREIKGGSIKLYRVFFDTATQAVQVINSVPQIFLRFDGIINNFAIQEDLQLEESTVTHTITVTASSILAVLENRVSGRRTNTYSYQTFYDEQNITTLIDNTATDAGGVDPSMDRVVALKAASFDFGKKK